MNAGQNRKTERRKSEQLARRKAIIRAAREVFFAEGFMNATIDEIADRCGLAKWTIYLGIVRDLIQEGIDNHYYRKVDAWAVANILWATVNGIIMSFEQDPQYREEIVGMKLEQMLLHALDLALEGLRA